MRSHARLIEFRAQAALVRDTVEGGRGHVVACCAAKGHGRHTRYDSGADAAIPIPACRNG